MKCVHWQGKLERGCAPFHATRKGYHLTLENLPAWICAQCGETYFDEQQSAAIQETLQKLDEQAERLAVA